jgi:putative ABC transport system permease protein
VGRTFTQDDQRPDSNRVVLLSYDFWMRRFGGDRGVVNQQLMLNDYPFVVIGVLPQGFRFTEASNFSSFKFSERTDIWAPLIIGDRRNNRSFHNLGVIARLKPGVSWERANAEVQVFGQQAAQQYPDTNKSYGMKVISLGQQVTGDLKQVLLTIMVATGFVLLVACANLAILLLARASTRHRELATRMALGASRKQLFRQLLAESVFLSLIGGVIGIVVAYVGASLLIRFSPDKILQNNPLGIDLRVLAFTLTVSLLTGLLFGILPAYQGARADLMEDLKEGARGSTRRPLSLLRSLIVTEVALTIVLLIGVGLSIKSVIYLLRVDPGFNPDRIITMDIYLPIMRYKDPAQRMNLFTQALDKIRALPEVEAVGMNYALPFSGVNPSNTFQVEGQPSLKEGEFQSANLGLIDSDYFRALGIPLLSGRYFNEYDRSDSLPVAIIDERMAEKFFSGENPIGRRISIAGNQLLSIVGVVRTIKHDAFETTARPYVYLPYQQRSYSYTSLAVRTNMKNPAGLVLSVREAMRTVDKDLPIANISTLEESYSRAISPRRYTMLLMIVFGVIALLLTVTGIYGVVDYSVQQRQQEIGIRMALGAQPRQVLWLFLWHNLVSLVIGLSIGLLVSVGFARLMTSLVYGISPTDLTTYLAVLLLIANAALLASYLPAKRATRVNPTDILRIG